MPKVDMWLKIGSWSFLIGIVIALVVGLYQAYTIETETFLTSFFYTDTCGAVGWVLGILGAIVGIIAFMGKGTITAKEIPAFLMAGIALVIMGGVFQNYYQILNPWIGSLLSGVSMSLAIFVAPAVGLLSIMAIWVIGKDV